MRTVKLQINDDVYSNVMFILNSLKIKGLEIIENSPKKKDTKELLQSLLASKKVEVFESIENPVKWQRQKREEW